MSLYVQRHFRHNFTVNVLDGGFFVLGVSFASFVTILPLFVSHLTHSALLIGLIPAIHTVFWQLPQLFTARAVAGRASLKPMVLTMTLIERLPYALLGVLALGLGLLSPTVALLLIFALLVLQGLGAGLTANFWQTMISRTIPPRRWGTFFGSQAAFGSLLGTGGAVAAGWLLVVLPYPQNFAVCFFVCIACMTVSWFFLASTREPPISNMPPPSSALDFRRQVTGILRRDRNFRWYLVSRWLQAVVMIPSAFIAVYAAQRYRADPAFLGVLTGSLMVTQMLANPLIGLIGDRWGHRLAMIIGAVAGVAVPLLALVAAAPGWLFGLFVLTGLASTVVWVIGITLTMQFGTDAERPAYVGLANTLTAPAAVLAPLVGGWLVDNAGYPAMFWLSLVGGVLTVAVLWFAVREPAHEAAMNSIQAAAPEA